MKKSKYIVLMFLSLLLLCSCSAHKTTGGCNGGTCTAGEVVLTNRS